MDPTEFAKRSAMYEARGNALEAADQRERQIKGLVNLAQILLALLVVMLTWQWLTARVLVIEVMALFILRGLSAVLVYHFFTLPTMRTINERYPAPEPKP